MKVIAVCGKKRSEIELPCMNEFLGESTYGG